MKVTKGMAKHFLTAHESCTVNSAITYAHVMSLGGNWTIYFDLFCSDLCDYIEGDRFWMSVAEYIIKNKSLFNVATIWNLYEYINYIKFSNNAAEPDFEIKGRSPEKLISKAVEYDTKSRYIVTNVCWTPLRIKGYIKSDDINSEHYYIIEQISDFASLMNEASEQHNCLETYLDDCITGETSVWSLYLTLNCSKKKIKLVTIEVKPDKTISQALGKCNRYITGFEMQIIQEWALREGLYISDKIKIK